MPAVGQIFIPRQISGLRDSHWLNHEMERIWASCFDDTPRINDVQIRFAGGWKNRLGVISLSEDKLTSYIGINALLSLPEVPECIARITIAHELVHYAHGFGSRLPRLHRHPHRGRIVERGTHVALLAANGTYARMWQLQQDERRNAGASPATAGDDAGDPASSGAFEPNPAPAAEAAATLRSAP
jgi:hypothetical protein